MDLNTKLNKINPNRERMQEIITRLKYIDKKRYKYIDGEISAKEYDVFKKEAIALRIEYRKLEGI